MYRKERVARTSRDDSADGLGELHAFIHFFRLQHRQQQI